MIIVEDSQGNRLTFSGQLCIHPPSNGETRFRIDTYYCSAIEKIFKDECYWLNILEANSATGSIAYDELHWDQRTGSLIIKGLWRREPIVKETTKPKDLGTVEGMIAFLQTQPLASQVHAPVTNRLNAKLTGGKLINGIVHLWSD